MAESKLQVLIQDRRSRLYLAGPDKWTPHISEAVDFKLLENAHHFVRTEPIESVKIVPRFARVPLGQAA